MKSISALVIGKQWDIVTQRLLHQSFNKMLSNLGVRRSVSLLSEVSYFKQKRHEKDCNRYQNSKPADGYGRSCWEIVFTLFPPQKRNSSDRNAFLRQSIVLSGRKRCAHVCGQSRFLPVGPDTLRMSDPMRLNPNI